MTGIAPVDWMAANLAAATATQWAAAAAGVLALLQVVLMVLLARAQRTVARAGSRLDQLTAALEMLTDTTESGFVNMSAALERLGKFQVATTSGRRATARRIAHATRHGHSVGAIAAAEGLSESEVGLHLGLEAAERHARPVDEGGADDRDLAPSAGDDDTRIPFDPNQWTITLQRRDTPSRGARHAALRV